jgi:hypothetical protein
LLTPPNDGTQKENRLDLRVALKMGAGHLAMRRAAISASDIPLFFILKPELTSTGKVAVYAPNDI